MNHAISYKVKLNKHQDYVYSKLPFRSQLNYLLSFAGIKLTELERVKVAALKPQIILPSRLAHMMGEKRRKAQYDITQRKRYEQEQLVRSITPQQLLAIRKILLNM